MPASAAAAEHPGKASSHRLRLPVKSTKAGAQQELYCDAWIDTNSSGIVHDIVLEETVTFTYRADVECNYYLAQIYGAAFAIDRSPSFNGEIFDNFIIGDGTLIDDVETYYGTSVGGFYAEAFYYNGARRAEAAFELYLLNPVELYWGGCGDLGDLRYLLCEWDRELLHVVVGTGGEGTGLTQACRNQADIGDLEQRRIFTLAGSVPAATTLIERVPSIRNEVLSFKRDICLQGASTAFAQQRGQRLWDTALTAAKQDVAGGDDRALYWARLHLRLALRQYRPVPGDLGQAAAQLESASRGMLSAAFTGIGKRVVVSGFDPFGLDQVAFTGADINRDNPSGAAALRYDNENVGGAQVQAVIFPVRFKDFDDGMVELFFDPYLRRNSGQTADLVITSSRGADTRFALEYYNGRNRSFPRELPDNVNVDAPGSFDNPQPPPTIDGGEQFVPTTLPVLTVASLAPGQAAVNFTVAEQRNTSAGRQPSSFSNDGPTVASTSVAGSGGGFLSNEIAYRVTRLRDQLESDVMAGHYHTPPSSFSDSERRVIVDTFGSLLNITVNAPRPTPPKLTLDKTLYRVGESQTFTVTGPPGASILWSSSLNEIETGENDANYGDVLDSSGRFTVTVGPLPASFVGRWVKQVRINNILSTFEYEIVP
ncbi:MAG TPA: hypothetical protein VF062_12020 [Candidatus Limnocylindrales bacterium]